MIAQLTLDDIAVDLATARQWKAANPAAYAAIAEWAREDMANGVKPAIDMYANLLRRPHFARRLGLVRTDVVYALNNNLRAELARLLMEDFTDIRFELRHSRADAIGVGNATPRVGEAAS